MSSLRERKWCRLYGNTTTAFEKKWAEALGAKYTIGVVNGTNALYAALSAVDVGPGDEVIVPPYTFVATINAVIQQYALPVFVDTDLQTQQMDASTIEAAVNPNTRCILPVHLGGNVANMGEIKKIASRHSIPVVEDACQAHFAEWQGQKAGAVGDIGCFSFQSTKILPCGEGGAVVTSRDDLYDRLHAFQNNGRDRVTGTRQGYLHQGTNLRMTEFQSALLLAQLTRLEEQCVRRGQNARLLTSLLNEIPGIEPASMHDGCTRNTYYIYMARYNPQEFKGLSRSGFLRALNREGIRCGTGYKPLNKEPFLERVFQSRHYARLFSPERLERFRDENNCPVNEELSKQGLFLSHRCLLGSEQDIVEVAGAIDRIRKHASEIAQKT
jgi:dTDP-4-amino-4,6-dideoxygalactose transaminase